MTITVESGFILKPIQYPHEDRGMSIRIPGLERNRHVGEGAAGEDGCLGETTDDGLDEIPFAGCFYSPAFSLLLLQHRCNFALQSQLQLVHRFIEIPGRGDGERIVTLPVMVVYRKFDLPVCSLLWFDDELCHNY